MGIIGAHDETIARIHHSGWQMVIAVTGGGSSAISELLLVPGASQSVLEAVVPYAHSALLDWLKAAPEQACSPRAARAMAMAAFQRASKLADPSVDRARLMGIGCTASIASDRPKRGAHRYYLAFQTQEFTHTYWQELEKGKRTRLFEDGLISHAIISEIAVLCGVQQRERIDPATNLSSPERIYMVYTAAPVEWQRLLVGEQSVAGNEAALRMAPQVIFPGAFHPLHDGHREMLRVAQLRLPAPVAMEISIENVDKPPLDFTEIEERTRQFDAAQPYFLTRAPTFVEKADIFPGCTFIVGADTITRIAQPKYYQHDVALRDQALATLAARGCRFLVFGRVAGAEFRTLAELELPERLLKLCDQVPASEFRADISSTALRQQAEQQQQ